MYQEGSSTPYDVIQHVEYYQEDVLPELDLERDVVSEWGVQKKTLMQTVSGAYDAIYPFIGIAVVGVILVYAFLTGGSRWRQSRRLAESRTRTLITWTRSSRSGRTRSATAFSHS